jgi:hypothetical protein
MDVLTEGDSTFHLGSCLRGCLFMHFMLYPINKMVEKIATNKLDPGGLRSKADVVARGKKANQWTGCPKS